MLGAGQINILLQFDFCFDQVDLDKINLVKNPMFNGLIIKLCS